MTLCDRHACYYHECGAQLVHRCCLMLDPLISACLEAVRQGPDDNLGALRLCRRTIWIQKRLTELLCFLKETQARINQNYINIAWGVLQRGYMRVGRMLQISFRQRMRSIKSKVAAQHICMGRRVGPRTLRRYSSSS